MRQLFEQEYPKHEKALFLVALSYLHNTEDARDAVQEAALFFVASATVFTVKLCAVGSPSEKLSVPILPQVQL